MSLVWYQTTSNSKAPVLDFETVYVKIELLVLDSNTWNHLSMCKQVINII